jgi:polysaccharide transporter, PST family
MRHTSRPPLRTRVMNGAILSLGAQVYRTVVGFVSGIILARLLTPDDFGLVAIASSCIAFVGVVQDLGLNMASIQREEIGLRQISGLFWISAGSGLIFAVLLTLLAPTVAWLFGDQRLKALTAVFAVTIAVGGFQSPLIALMHRQFRFKALAAIDILAGTTGVIAALIVACLTSSYWALVALPVVGSVTNLVCASLVCRFRPSAPSFEDDFRRLFKFGTGMFGYNISNYLARNADNLLIGKFCGGEELGLYDRAYRLLMLPLLQVLVPFGRVMLPLLSRLINEPHRYRAAYGESISLVMIATHPGIIFAVVFAGEVFRLLLGPQWEPAVPIFQWLGLCGLNQVMTSSLSWLLISQERTGDLFKVGLCNAVISIAAVVAGIRWGGLGVAIAYTIANNLAVAPVTWRMVGRRGPVSTGDLISIGLPHALGAIASAGIMVGVSHIGSLNILTSLALATLSYGVYLVTLMMFPIKRRIAVRTLRFVVAHGIN